LLSQNLRPFYPPLILALCFPPENRVIEFEWDKNKAATNKKKHGVSFSEATTVFGDPLELTIEDTEHSSGEYRFLSVGRSNTGNILVVSYTEREPNLIRIISARKATKNELKYYEQN
jgi:uncharacterized DUF497 family protein